jgi:hypothetical protein
MRVKMKVTNSLRNSWYNLQIENIDREIIAYY